MALEFNCPHCDSLLAIDETWRKTEAKCPNCGNSLILGKVVPEKGKAERANKKQDGRQAKGNEETILNKLKEPGEKIAKGYWNFLKGSNKPVGRYQKCGKEVSPQAIICKHCGGQMRKSKQATSGGMGCILIILGIVLTPAIIGIPIILYGLHLGMKRRGFWLCKNCGYQFERKLEWHEWG